MNVYDDLGYNRPVSKEQKEKSKQEYKRLMKLFRARQPKPTTERETVIKEGRF